MNKKRLGTTLLRDIVKTTNANEGICHFVSKRCEDSIIIFKRRPLFGDVETTAIL